MLRPFRVMALYGGGTFDSNYNRRYEPIKFSVPALARKVSVAAILTRLPRRAPF